LFVIDITDYRIGRCVNVERRKRARTNRDCRLRPVAFRPGAAPFGFRGYSPLRGILESADAEVIRPDMLEQAFQGAGAEIAPMAWPWHHRARFG
jgi:hypothetical protein